MNIIWINVFILNIRISTTNDLGTMSYVDTYLYCAYPSIIYYTSVHRYLEDDSEEGKYDNNGVFIFYSRVS